MENKKHVVKEAIRQLHAGASVREVKERFQQVLEGLSPVEIAQIEQELVKEGMSREEVRRLCDVHLAVFREQLEKQRLDVPEWHPLNILMEEHKILLELSERLQAVADKIRRLTERGYADVAELMHLARDLQDAEKHYLREENVLFPVLERHGVTEPPAIMWMEHNQIRERKRQLRSLVERYGTTGFEDFKRQLGEVVDALGELLPSHFFKENNVLFPTGLRIISADEWKASRREFDEVDYCCFTPAHLVTLEKKIALEAETGAVPVSVGMLQFENGSLSKEEVEAILDALPVDISFVGSDDGVKYFNKADRRIFVRTKAIIGRKVQMCHPQKSVHIVNKIIEAFKTGKQSAAEFWIDLNDRLVHIRYFAVRDRDGKYLGTMEVTQDITDIKKIEGQKRLLDWQA